MSFPEEAQTSLWRPLKPETVLKFDPRTLSPQFSKENATCHELPNAGSLFSVPILTDEFCEDLVAELRAYTDAGRPYGGAHFNGIRSWKSTGYPMRLAELGFGFLDEFVKGPVTKVVNELYPGVGPLECGHAHSIHRMHDGSKETSILPGSNQAPLHTDGSVITVNINIGGKWTGGGLRAFDDGNKTEEPDLVLAQQKGHALIHPGHILHQGAPLHSGDRHNLVIFTTRSD
mmetsp:Transcript_97164/g.173081  ORF Transcript_97164/g.173081 Transcript_97164/m.173081 type:complete len:231 (-) Transcript_97164:145-837(-)